MSCCCETGDGRGGGDRNDPNNDPEMMEKLRAAADFSGPTRNRHCTDVLCLSLVLLMWAALTAIGAYSIANGDYRLVLYPLDYDGNVCGTDFAPEGRDMTDYPYLLYVNSMTGGVCVETCPNLQDATGDPNVTADVRTFVTYSGMWQPTSANTNTTDGDGDAAAQPLIPLDYVRVADYTNASDARACTYETCFPDNDSPAESWPSEGVNQGFGYAYYVGTTYSLLQRCFLTAEADAAISQQVNATAFLDLSGAGDAYNFFNRLYADLFAARAYILGFGFGASFVVSFSYIFLLRIPLVLTAVVWSSILITIAAFFVGGWYAWDLYVQWSSVSTTAAATTSATAPPEDDFTIRATQIAAIVLWVVGAVLVILACCLRKQIQLAISCTREAGKAINGMILILLIPVLQAAGFVAFLVVFVVYAVYLASLGTITVDSFQGVTYRLYDFDDFVLRCGWYLIFCLFWTANFIVALGDVMISLSVAKWYFTKNKATVGSWTVLGSIGQTLFYHAGTCAYGSLFIAIVQIIRWIIAKFQRAAKTANSSVARVVLCCCQCCFCCLESCLRYITKNAYIHTAIFGTAFCKSCRKSFFLILRNSGRISAVSYVSAAILIVGKLFISSVTTICAYFLIVNQLSDELFSVAGPIVLIFLISYWVSDFFMDVFDMAILTILLCFIADEEMFDEEEDRYAETALKRWVDKHGSGDN